MNRSPESHSPRFHSYLLTTFLLAVGGLLAAPAAVVAQASPAQQDADAQEEENAQEEAGQPIIEEEIVVTARKREENVQQVPVAVSVLPGESLEDANYGDIAEIQGRVPNLSIYPGRNQSTTLTAFMRGIGQADPLWGVDPGVGLYLDDVYIARPQGALLDVYDVQRVEVLRGPQGTLYGKNTIGGAIKYVSRELTDTPEMRLSFTAGDYDTREGRFSIAGPLASGKLRAKLAVASLQHEGYGTNLFTGREVSNKDTTAFRLGLDWLPSERASVKFSYDRTRDDAEPKGLTRLAANPFCAVFLGEPCPPHPNLFDTRSGLEPTNGTDSEGFSMVISWDLGANWQFKSITAYRESDTDNNIDFDTTPALITDVFATYFDEQTSQEFQFLYRGGDRLDGVLGLYYFDGSAGGLVQNIFFGGLVNGTTDGDTDTDSLAVFGEGSYALTDDLTFNFGLRATEEDKNGRAFNALYTDTTFTTVAAVTADYDKTASFSSVSPKLGLDYRFTDDVMGYVSLSRGFKSGGFNVRAQSEAFPASAEPFEDEELTVAEVGVKSVLADRQLVLNTAFFTGDYTDIQVSTFTSYDSDGDGADDAFFGNFLNAGDATIQGVELEFDFSPRGASWFGLAGNVSYLNADPDSFLDENNDGFVDTQVITNAPELTGGLDLQFNFPAFGGLITGSVAYLYRDDSVLTNEGGAHPADPTRPLLPLVQPSFDLLNARIGWFSGDGRWSFNVNGKNLGGEEYLTNGYNIPVLGLLQGSYGAPRTVTATIGYNVAWSR